MSNGFDKAPDRYTSKGRETIDRIRDELGDDGFKAFCVGNSMKYEDRAGAKGDPDGDAEKARWYRQMAAHVDGEAEDPRSGRDGFVLYTFRGEPLKSNCWTCAHDHFEDGEHWCRLWSSLVGLDESGAQAAVADREQWAKGYKFDESDMPPRTADGCPGWKAKP